MGPASTVRGWAIAFAVVLAVLVAVLVLTKVLGDDDDACTAVSAVNCTEPEFSPDK